MQLIIFCMFILGEFSVVGESEPTPASPTSSSATSTTDATSLASTGVSAAATLATAGHTLEYSEAEIVLLPLRLAFETKQPKLVESALDCLHVRKTVLFEFYMVKLLKFSTNCEVHGIFSRI